MIRSRRGGRSRRPGRCGVTALAFCFSGLAVGQLALAQTGTDLQRFERTLERIERQTRRDAQPAPIGQRVYFDFGAVVQFNLLSFDDSVGESHALRQYDLIGWGNLNLDGVHDFFLRGRTSYRDWGSGDAVDPAGDDWVEARLDRAVYRFDLGRAIELNQGTRPDTNVVFSGGRQLVHWFNGLVLSQELDAAVVSLTHDKWTVTGLAGFATRGTFDIDPARPGFDGDTRRGFYGGIIEYQLTPRHRPFVYGLVQRDYNDRDVLVTGVTTRFHYDSHYIGFGSTGNLSDQIYYGLEVALQGGETFSDSTRGPQTRDDIEAWALDVLLGYLFADENRTRANFELIVASGDDDRLIAGSTLGGNAPGTDDHSFQSFGLLNTGLAFAPEVSNLIVVRGGVSTFPFANVDLLKRLVVGVDLLVFNKFDDDAPISEPTTSDGYLGVEADLFAQWQVTTDLSLALRYGIFLPGDAIPDDSARQFVLTTVSFAF